MAGKVIQNFIHQILTKSHKFLKWTNDYLSQNCIGQSCTCSASSISRKEPKSISGPVSVRSGSAVHQRARCLASDTLLLFETKYRCCFIFYYWGQCFSGRQASPDGQFFFLIYNGFCSCVTFICSDGDVIWYVVSPTSPLTTSRS